MKEKEARKPGKRCDKAALLGADQAHSSFDTNSLLRFIKATEIGNNNIKCMRKSKMILVDYFRQQSEPIQYDDIVVLGKRSKSIATRISSTATEHFRQINVRLG